MTVGSPSCPICGATKDAEEPDGHCMCCALTRAVPLPGSSGQNIVPPQPGTGCAPNLGDFGDYQLLDEIARGGMGIVFRARQVRLNRLVALKLVLSGSIAGEADIRRFYQEAELAALDHPGIVPVFEFGEHEGRPFFSLGLVEGQSLAQAIAAGPLPPRRAAELVRQIAEAVQYAHDRGVVHRDLKPANVLLDEQVRPRVTDFGLARRFDSDSQLTATGQVMGTPSFMAPEQALGKDEDDSGEDLTIVEERASTFGLGWKGRDQGFDQSPEFFGE